MSLWRQDKEQAGCAVAFVAAVREGRPSPIPLEELLEMRRVMIANAPVGSDLDNRLKRKMKGSDFHNLTFISIQYGIRYWEC